MQRRLDRFDPMKRCLVARSESGRSLLAAGPMNWQSPPRVEGRHTTVTVFMWDRLFFLAVDQTDFILSLMAAPTTSEFWLFSTAISCGESSSAKMSSANEHSWVIRCRASTCA